MHYSIKDIDPSLLIHKKLKFDINVKYTSLSVNYVLCIVYYLRPLVKFTTVQLLDSYLIYTLLDNRTRISSPNIKLILNSPTPRDSSQLRILQHRLTLLERNLNKVSLTGYIDIHHKIHDCSSNVTHPTSFTHRGAIHQLMSPQLSSSSTDVQ